MLYDFLLGDVFPKVLAMVSVGFPIYDHRSRLANTVSLQIVVLSKTFSLKCSGSTQRLYFRQTMGASLPGSLTCHLNVC